jgi:hypothetical protein
MSQWNTLNSYLKQTKMSFFKNGGQEGKTRSVWGLVPECVCVCLCVCVEAKGEGVWILCGLEPLLKIYCSILMYENGKMTSIWAMLRMGRGGIKENNGGGDFN